MINCFSMGCRPNLTSIILLFAMSWSVGVSAELPRSTLVDSAQSSDDGLIRVVLGGIENVPRGIVAENEILLEGRQFVSVFEAPPSMSHETVRDALVANRVNRLQQRVVTHDVHASQHRKKRAPPNRGHHALHVHGISNVRRAFGHPPGAIKNGVHHLIDRVVLLILATLMKMRL